MKLQISSHNQKRNNFFSRIFFFFSPFIVFRIHENSMYPFLKDGDKILIYKFPYLFKNPQINDVIVMKSPQIKYLLKRITKIKKNELYIEGDNKEKSYDSRHFGWVDKNQIVGKMMVKL